MSLTAGQHHHHSRPYNVVTKSSTTATDNRLWHAHGYSEHDPLIPQTTAYGSISLSRSASNASQSSPLLLLPACDDRPLSLLDQASADLIPFAAYLRGIFSGSREESNKPVRNVLALSCEARVLIHIDGRGVV